jgi:hypothetical protein
MTGHLAIGRPNDPMAELILRMNSDWGYRLSLLSGSCVFIKEFNVSCVDPFSAQSWQTEAAPNSQD